MLDYRNNYNEYYELYGDILDKEDAESRNKSININKNDDDVYNLREKIVLQTASVLTEFLHELFYSDEQVTRRAKREKRRELRRLNKNQ